jgi:hypothetical protein
MSIKIYGVQAQKFKQGQQYLAVVHDVEGRTVVELKPIEKVYS